MTEPLRIWDAKNLRWINEPHVPVARSPNPVSPKTDTPATQAEEMPYKGSPLERIDNLRAQLSAERASHAQTLSTLAAERASRLQAEKQLAVYQTAFHDACIDAHPEDDGFQVYKLQGLRNAEAELEMLNIVVPIFMKELGLNLEDASKPSVSPEQAEEKR